MLRGLDPVEPVSVICRRTGMQWCHICEDARCGDNQNPTIVKLKRELDELRRAAKPKPA